jgi:hypothetical protein
MADAIDIIRESINAWNAHDPDGVAKLVSNDFVSESDTLPAAVRGPDAVRQEVQLYVRSPICTSRSSRCCPAATT